MVDGTPRLGQLLSAARDVLGRASADDALWLITADGIPRRGDRPAISQLLDGVTSSSRRLDLGSAVTLAEEVLAPETRPGEIMLLTDLQASALSAARPTAPLVVARPETPSPPNAGIGGVDVGSQPWPSEGGRITVSLVGDSGPPIPVTARLGDRSARQALGHVGAGATINLPGAPSGWWTLTTELAPDELRTDDQRVAAVRIAPVARVDCDSTSRYLAAACEVLASNRRIARGQEVLLGRLGRGPSVVQPPEDPARIGALNRSLAARGIAWSYTDLLIQPELSDSGRLLGRHRVLRRYVLRPTSSGRTGVLATVQGSPWIVRSGNAVLLGSRLEPAWTELPVSAAFMPFMDALLNRVARGEVTLQRAAAGDPVELPDQVSGVRQGEREWRVEGGGLFRATEPGVHFLLAGRDTVGAISINPDPRESQLARADDAQARRLWRGARIVALDEAGEVAFSSASRGDLRGPLLWLALLVGLAEVGLASAVRRRA
jgi:hypothetical protein